MLEELIRCSLEFEKHGDEKERMDLMTALGHSESGTRALLKEDELFPFLATQLSMKSGLAYRARSSMVLRAMSDFPVGRRALAESEVITEAFFQSLSLDIINSKNDHPAIRANIIDILGQMLNDPTGHQKLKQRELDSILQEMMNIARREEWHEVFEACVEVNAMQRWWFGEQKQVGGR